MSEERCQHVIPKLRFMGRDVAPARVCGRLMTDLCGVCKWVDAHKDERHAVFNEYRDEPRKAVEGDI